MKTLLELALNRSEAANRCLSLGEQFITHFHKVYEEGVNGDSFHHHCSEMQGWWDTVTRIRLKPKGKLIPYSQLHDWFFTAGSEVGDYLSDDDEQECYEILIRTLNRGDKVEDLIRSILVSH